MRARSDPINHHPPPAPDFGTGSLGEPQAASALDGGYPAPPVTWIVQNFDLDLSQVDPPNAEGYLDSLLKEKGELDSEVESTQVRRSVGKHRRGLTGASHLELYRLFSWRCCSDV